MPEFNSHYNPYLESFRKNIDNLTLKHIYVGATGGVSGVGGSQSPRGGVIGPPHNFHHSNNFNKLNSNKLTTVASMNHYEKN